MIIAHGKLIASDTPENLEQRLKGAAGLELTVKGSEETVRTVLGEIHGLSKGWLLIHFSDPRRIRRLSNPVFCLKKKKTNGKHHLYPKKKLAN